MKATEHIASKQVPTKPTSKEELDPKVEPKEEEPRPPAGVSEIQKQMAILEGQSLTSRQEAAVAEIRKIIGEVEPPEPPVQSKHQSQK